MTRKNLIDMAEFMGVDVREAMTARVRYLAEQRDIVDRDIETYGDEILFNDDLNDVTRVFLSLRIEANKKKISKLIREIKSFTQLPKEGEITEDDIETARQYPIENLIELKGGRCIAFCHPSNSYSMVKSRTGNYLWCNVCGRGFDSLAVLMERDGYSFIDAVKQLTT